MARIPTYVSQASIATGSTGPHANAGSFGVDASGLAAGLGQGANALGAMAERSNQERDEAKAKEVRRVAMNQVADEKDGIRYASELKTQFQDEYLAKLRELKDSENGHQEFTAWVDKRIPQVLAGATTRDSGLYLKQELSEFRVSGRNIAAQRSAEVKVGKLVSVVAGGVAADIRLSAEESDLAGNVADFNPDTSNLKRIDKRMREIDAYFSASAPGVAGQQKLWAANQYFNAAIIAGRPDLAREIATRFVSDEDKKRAMIADASRIEKSHDEVRSVEAGLFIDAANDSAKLGGGKVAPREFYVAHLGEKAGSAKFTEDSFRNSFMARGAAIANEVKGLNAEAQESVKESLRARVAAGEVGSKDALATAEKIISDSQELQKKDLATWMTSYNPVVGAAAQQAQNLLDRYNVLPDGPDKNMALEAYRGAAKTKFSLIAKYSGKAPDADADGAALSPQERARYIGMPDGMINFMGTKEASDAVKDILSGSADQALKSINERLAFYPKEFHSPVYQQLVRAGLPDMHQTLMALSGTDPQSAADSRYLMLAYKNRNEPIPQVSLTNLAKAVQANPTFKMFNEGMGTAGVDTAGAGKQFMESGEVLARQYLRDGVARSEYQAAQMAADLIINKNYMAGSVNGRGLWLARKKADGSAYSDGEAGAIFDNLTLALRAIDPESIDLRNLPSAKERLDVSGRITGDDSTKQKVKAEAWEDIATNAVWAPDGDGRSVSLWFPIKDSKGGFSGYGAVTTKNGKQVRLRLSDVPTEPSRLADGAQAAMLDDSIFRLQGEGFSGMLNLLNPFSPENVANRIYGTGPASIGPGLGGLYIGNPRGGSFWGASNWPELTPTFNARGAMEAASK